MYLNRYFFEKTFGGILLLNLRRMFFSLRTPEKRKKERKMSKKQRTAEQSHFTNICSLCQDEHKNAKMCACEKWFCKDCLLIECSSQLQDEPKMMACTHCGIPTLCSICSIVTFYQGCIICKQQEGLPSKYLNVCPQCIFQEEALSLIPESEKTPSLEVLPEQLYQLIKAEEEIIAIVHHGSPLTDNLNMAWYCPMHRPGQSDSIPETATPPFSDYSGSEVFDVDCSDEDVPDWSDFCIMPNIIHLSQEFSSPSSSPAH